MQAKSSITLMLWLVLSGNCLRATAATSIFIDNNRPAVRKFVAVYAAYIAAVKRHGAAGLQKIAAPDFTLTVDGKTIQGREAFVALEQPLDGLQEGIFYVNIPKVILTSRTAAALMEETTGRKLDPRTTLTTTRYLTQTWQKTAKGWELEASAQRPSEIKGPSPIMTHRFGSIPDTPLTINVSALGADLGVPPTSGPVLDVYGPYLDALRRHDETAFHSLLTPGFTFTDNGKVLSHQAALKLTGQIHGLMKEYPGYYLTVNKLFVKSTRATGVVEERFLGASPQDPAISGSYFWTQNWIMTPQGWKLDNITRTR